MSKRILRAGLMTRASRGIGAVRMAERIFPHQARGVDREAGAAADVPLGLGSLSVGYVTEWAKNILLGRAPENTRPNHSMAVSSAVAAWAGDTEGSLSHGFDDLPWIFQGALIYSELRQSAPVMESDGAGIMVRVALSADARAVYSVILQSAPQPGASEAGENTYMIGVYKASQEIMYFFDPDRGLFKCASRGDFWTATQYLTDVYTGAAFASAIHLSRNLQ